MYFEVITKRENIDAKTGKVAKTKRTVHLVEAMTFAEAEHIIVRHTGADPEQEVIAMHRSRIAELFNPKDIRPLWRVKLTEELPEGKKSRWYALVCAADIKEAQETATRHISQGYDNLTLEDITLSPIEEVIR